VVISARLTAADLSLLSGEIAPVRRFAAVPRTGDCLRVTIAGRETEARIVGVTWLDPGLGDDPRADVELLVDRPS
jgi:hypothetical protein